MNIDINIEKTILKTDRLTLRPWCQEDASDLFEYASIDGVGQMAGWLPHKNIEESQLITKMFIEEKKTFALEYKGKIIGSLGIEEYREDLFPALDLIKGRELGFGLSKDYWGQGLMVEACNEVIKWLFKEVGCDFITCGYFLDNSQSKRVQEKLGFSYLMEIEYKTSGLATKSCNYNIVWKHQFK